MLKVSRAGELTELEAYQVKEFWLSVLYNLELAHSEMSEDELQSAVNRFRGFFATNSGLQATWANESGRFNSQFVSWVEETLINH